MGIDMRKTSFKTKGVFFNLTQPKTTKQAMAQQGTINVTTDNIFPIIKQFLYSDQEIFLRELVSNAVDATQKRKMLAQLGEVVPDPLLGRQRVREVR